MKLLATLTAAFLFLVVGFSVPAFSQEREDNKPQAQGEKNKNKDKDNEARPEGKHQQDQPGARQDERREPAAARPEHESRPQEQREQKEQRPEQRQLDRDNHQHPMNAHQGKKIPDDKFRTSFGHEHRFKARQVITETRVVPGQTRFIYSGYTFVFVDPWPAEWAFDDDCYIDYVDDGYYLINPYHPGIRVSVIIGG
jgi:hypothetical protein